MKITVSAHLHSNALFMAITSYKSLV